MYISKSLFNIKLEKEDFNVEKDKYYLSFIDPNTKNIIHSNIDIPMEKIYKKGVDLTNRKIFINTSFALGDTIHLIPVLKALKQTYGGIYIGVEHKEENKILENTPYIDDLIKRPINISVFDSFDYIVDITAHVATIGFDNRFVPDYLASIFGIRLLDKKPDINLSKNRDVILNINKIKRYISLGRPILGVHFESSSIHRRIPADVLDIILNYAKDKYTIVCAYTDAGKDLANEYFEKYPFIIDVSKHVKDVEHLINYVGILDILISAETSVGHIGAGLGKPTLVVMGASSFEDVYGYDLPYVKGVNARYVGTKCSSPCRIHATTGPCPEASYKKSQNLQENDYSPCFRFIDKIGLLNTFKSIEAFIENKNFSSNKDFEDRFFYYYTSNIINEYIGRSYEYFNKYRHTIFHFVREFGLRNKSVKVIGYDKVLYEEILKDNGVIIDDTSNNIIITDGFYNDIDFKSLKDKKALILFANKNRLYNLVKRGYDIFDLGVAKRAINEYKKDELIDILSKYFNKFNVFESPISYKEYELVYGSSNSQENILAHNAFMRSSINSLQGAFLVCVINNDTTLENPLDVYTTMQYEFLTADKYKDISMFSKSQKDGFDIIELKKGKKLNVFLAFEKEELFYFYNILKNMDIGIYTAYLPEIKDDIIQTLLNIGIDIAFTDLKSLKAKYYLPYIANKVIFIDRTTTLEDLKIYFEEKDFDIKFEKILSSFPISKTEFLITDDRIVSVLKEKSFKTELFYGYYADLYESNLDIKPSIIYLSDTSIHKTYSDNTITEFFIKKLSNFRTSLKAIKEDINEYELREYLYDYQYMGAYACKYNNKYIKHIGMMDFSDEIVFRVAMSTIENTRDFPDVIIYKHQLKSVFNPKNIVIGLSDILSNTLNKYMFEAFNNKTLFITDYKKPLEDIFGKYVDYISGYSIEDIVEKANYFKENKEEAKEVIDYIKSQIREFSLKNIIKKFI